MAANFWINKIEFKNGFELPLEEDSIVVFVGPNNAGKSQTLQELTTDAKYLQKGLKNCIIEDVKVSITGTGEELCSRLESTRRGNDFFYKNDTITGKVSSEQLMESWDNFYSTSYVNHRHSIPHFFVYQMNTTERLKLVNPPNSIDLINNYPGHPIHILQEHSAKEREFSEYFRLTFGKDIIVNHGAGANVPLHVGEKPNITAENDRVSSSYQHELRKLPVLNDQGDGMKSFAGVFLGLFAQDYSINIIDEPEAFLHPPQATLLGRMIAKNLGEKKQVFVATHSEHFLKGLLDAAPHRLIVVRIVREGQSSKINLLDKTEIQDIWNDSILRHSNILDSLFHKKVILSESDSDSRFYSAITHLLVEKHKLPAPDILFIQSGGKHRFPVIIKALRKLEIPIITIGDFDLYHEENPLKTTYENYGGDWSDIKEDFLKVKKAINEKRPELQVAELKKEIDSVFSNISSSIISDGEIKNIQTLLKKSSPWAQAKSSGKSYLQAGEATNAFNNVQTKLKEKGIIILEIGEIEAFDKTVGGHGPKWVNKVLEKDIYNDDDLKSAREFVLNNILS